MFDIWPISWIASWPEPPPFLAIIIGFGALVLQLVCYYHIFRFIFVRWTKRRAKRAAKAFGVILLSSWILLAIFHDPTDIAGI